MNRIAGFVIVALVAIVGAVLFTHYFDRVTERVRVGFKGEAARNDFLAADRFLQRLGNDVHYVRSMTQLDQLDRNAMLLLARLPSQGERERLLAWVRGGGHLVLTAPQSQDVLMKEVGITFFSPEDETEEGGEEGGSATDTTKDAQSDAATDAATTDASTSAATSDAPAQQPAEAESANAPSAPAKKAEKEKAPQCPEERPWCQPTTLVGDEQQQFKLELSPYLRLTQTEDNDRQPLRAMSDDQGDVMLEYPLDKGRITVLTSDDMLRNTLIGENDHAAWLNYLVGKSKRSIWFADIPLDTSLWAWLKTHAWPVLIAAAITIALGLWRALTRFGPTLPAEAPGRLSFRDHLVAVGRFHWRHAAAGHLLQSAERETQRAELGSLAVQTGSKAKLILGRTADAPGFVNAIKGLQRRLSAQAASRDKTKR